SVRSAAPVESSTSRRRFIVERAAFFSLVAVLCFPWGNTLCRCPQPGCGEVRSAILRRLHRVNNNRRPQTRLLGCSTFRVAARAGEPSNCWRTVAA
ncbi:MAG: hypothetical protein NZ561_07070, partial [Phycisphaerae bacterium]|nr:hypothetical protein [Phycisphaerae bacterium]